MKEAMRKKIIDSIREREEDANEFILSQKKWADMHIRCEKIDKLEELKQKILNIRFHYQIH